MAGSFVPRWVGEAEADFNSCGDILPGSTGLGSIRHRFSNDTFDAVRRGELEAKKTGALINFYLWSLMETLELLGCKNVSLAPHDGDPKQVRRAVKRHGGNPDDYRYHTLVVRPAGAKSDSPSQEIGIMPRHLCREHFAEYGPEFGKGLLF